MSQNMIAIKMVGLVKDNNKKMQSKTDCIFYYYLKISTIIYLILLLEIIFFPHSNSFTLLSSDFILPSVMDTQTAGKDCRLGFLILEAVTDQSRNRCTQQLGLVSILGTRNATSYPPLLSRY